MTIMLVYLSHSPSDSKLYKSLRDQCETKGFTPVSGERPFDFGETFTERTKRKIEMANVAVILMSSYGRSSYRVFQEVNFIESTRKDHFVIEGSGKMAFVKRHVFKNGSSAIGDEHYSSSLLSLEKLLNEFAANLEAAQFNFIYHTELVY